MKVIDILSEDGDATPSDDVGFQDQVQQRESPTAQAPEDFKGAARASRPGKNGKKAARIAAAAKTKARDANPGDGETISQSGGGTTLNFRLGR